jgi:ATP-binding cassette subfamily B (MDR/TAP) protein 1
MNMFVVYAVIFYIGAIFVREQYILVIDMFTSIFAIIFAAFGAGNTA